MTHTDWTWDDDYRTATLERVTPHGVFRARVDRDDYPEPPYFDGGDPIYTESGAHVYGATGATVDRVGEALALTRPGAYSWRGEWTPETFERYVRIFHAGTVRWFAPGYRSEVTYAAVALPAVRRELGVPDDRLGDEPDTTEWTAYCEGDVFLVAVDRAVSFDDDGEPDDWAEDEDYPVGGHYGETWAMQAAEEELAAVVDFTARDMLPLEGVTA